MAKNQQVEQGRQYRRTDGLEGNFPETQQLFVEESPETDH
jgi:hypothetical protein